MGIHIPYVEHFDPLTEGDRTWVDRSQIYASSRYKMIQQETQHVEAKLEPKDKFEFTARPPESYQIERGTMTDAVQQIYEENLNRYREDERRESDMSIVARNNYRREIGQNIDLSA